MNSAPRNFTITVDPRRRLYYDERVDILASSESGYPTIFLEFSDCRWPEVIDFFRPLNLDPSDDLDILEGHLIRNFQGLFHVFCQDADLLTIGFRLARRPIPSTLVH